MFLFRDPHLLSMFFLADSVLQKNDMFQNPESKERKRQLMTRGPSIVYVSLQRDAFCFGSFTSEARNIQTYACSFLFAIQLKSHVMIVA